jgi:hypothetical protein
MEGSSLYSQARLACWIVRTDLACEQLNGRNLPEVDRLYVIVSEQNSEGHRLGAGSAGLVVT